MWMSMNTNETYSYSGVAGFDSFPRGFDLLFQSIAFFDYTLQFIFTKNQLMKLGFKSM